MGFIKGSQSHLEPAWKQTDFIFTMLAEEFGLLGGLEFYYYFFLCCYGLVLSFYMIKVCPITGHRNDNNFSYTFLLILGW